MAYRLAAERKVWWPIKITSVKDGGGVEQAEVQILYLLIGRDELKANLAKALAPSQDKNILGKLADKITSAPDDDANLVKHVLDWKGVEDPDGNPITFSLANLKACMQDMYFAKALNEGLAEASYKAVLKN